MHSTWIYFNPVQRDFSTDGSVSRWRFSKAALVSISPLSLSSYTVIFWPALISRRHGDCDGQVGGCWSGWPVRTSLRPVQSNKSIPMTILYNLALFTWGEPPWCCGYKLCHMSISALGPRLNPHVLNSYSVFAIEHISWLWLLFILFSAQEEWGHALSIGEEEGGGGNRAIRYLPLQEGTYAYCDLKPKVCS